MKDIPPWKLVNDYLYGLSPGFDAFRGKSFAVFKFSANGLLRSTERGCWAFHQSRFSWYYLFVIITGCSSGATLFLSDSWSAALALAISAGAIYSLQVLMPRVNAARDEQFQQNTEAKRLFLRLHGLSVVINFVQLIAAGCVCFRLLRGTSLAL